MTTPEPRPATAAVPHASALALALAATVVSSLAAAAPAGAETPAYVGMWSKRMEHCSTGQKRPGAPMLITEKGFDQHDLHCTFETIEPVAGHAATWTILAQCTWKEQPAKMEMTWRVEGETLTVTDKGGSNTLRKCVLPPSPQP